MISQDKAQRVAREWVEAWNRRDLDAILDRYADDVVHSSPRVVDILNDPEGTVRGKQALRSYFEKGLQAVSDLQFELLEVLTGLDGLTIYYRNQSGRHVAEIMWLDNHGLVDRATVHYGPG